MGQAKKEPLSVYKLAENLASFAINRDDLKMLLRAMPQDNDINATTVEYELQILKILSAGWAISFYMKESENKKQLTQIFWQHIQQIAKNISDLTETTSGQQIDYFAVLKKRLDDYLEVMQENSKGLTDPSHVMGPAFADACGCHDNAAVILTGTKMLTLTLGAVKEYINAVEII